MLIIHENTVYLNGPMYATMRLFGPHDPNEKARLLVSHPDDYYVQALDSLKYAAAVRSLAGVTR